MAARQLSTKVHATSLNSFNANHVLYDQVRPTFNPTLVTSFFQNLDLIDDASNVIPNKRILELAAGTGKFTTEIVNRNLHSGGNELVVIEPSEGMLTSFKRNFPSLDSKIGSSYDLPLKDDSVDVIIIAQAFHWFSDSESVKELHRVLKKGGKLGLIWNFDSIVNNGNLPRSTVKLNVTPEDAKSLKTWENIAIGAHVYDAGLPQYRKGRWRDAFDNQNLFDLSQIKESLIYRINPYKKSSVYDYWLSRSFVTSLSDDEKAKFKKFVEETIAKAPEETLLDDEHLKQFLGSHYFVIPVTK